MIRIYDLFLGLDEPVENLREQILKRLNIASKDLIHYQIFKQSLDARRKNKIRFITSVEAEIQNEDQILKKLKDPKVIRVKNEHFFIPNLHRFPKNPPLVVGSGPAGLFSALVLAQAGLRPIILERGKQVEERVHDVQGFFKKGKLNPNSNIQFGEGGAGTFSDGKLYTQIKDTRSRFVIETLIRYGAPKEIAYDFKPHIGTDRLRRIIPAIREEIIRLGGSFRFESQLTGIRIQDGKLSAVEINGNEEIESRHLILAIGHSARDTFRMLFQSGIPMKPKAFAVGVRIEHLQKWIDQAQFGKLSAHPRLKAAEYKVVQHQKPLRSVYSFCMCPGGSVVAATSQEGQLVTNGMSEYARDLPNANSALLVGVSPEDFGSHPLDGVKWQEKWEKQAFLIGGSNYRAPAQLVGDFLRNQTGKGGIVNPSYPLGVRWTDLRDCLPPFVSQALKNALPLLNRKIKGFAHEEAVLTAIETRTSSPLRILRDQNYQSSIIGLYPAGEGAGYAGGIISAAVDGLRVASALIQSLSKDF